VGEFNEVSMGDMTVHAEARRARRKPRAATATAADPGRRNLGWNKKNGPRGRRKPLKRLDSDKEIKVNSKENPRIFQAIPRIFLGFSIQIKGFPKDAKPYALAPVEQAEWFSLARALAGPSIWGQQ
jgi:hypothetical protein